MVKIPIENLYPGLVLQRPLYDTKNVLLLAPGKQLTQEMMVSLRSSGHQWAFLGDTLRGDSARPARGQHISVLREQAEAEATRVESEFMRLLQRCEMEPRVLGTPMLATQRREPRKAPREARDHAEIAQVFDDADMIVTTVVDGEMRDEQVGPASAKAAERMADSISADPSLSAFRTLQKRDRPYLSAHSVNVCSLAMQIATAMCYTRTQVIEVGQAALLQDLGMALAPREITHAPRSLTTLEWREIHRHTRHGLFLMQRYRGAQAVPRLVAMQCHERLDGSGYPKGLKRANIHRFARIVAVADAFDALTSSRPWRAALHPYDAMEKLVRLAGTGTYDPDAVRGLLQSIALYPVGSFVRLNTGEVARVVHANGASYTRPVVVVLIWRHGRPCREPHYVDLAQSPDISIVSIVHEAPLENHLAGF